MFVKPCLVMILKNEAKIIEATLRAVKPFVSAFCIADTGSTDETKQIVLRTMQGLPGEVFDLEWQGYGAARTSVIDRARQNGHAYAFMVDADERFTPQPGFDWPLPTKAHSLSFLFDYSAVTFDQYRVFRLDLPWKYVCVLHEYPTFGVVASEVNSPIVANARLVPSFNSTRGVDPKKYEKDALVLEAELKTTGPDADEGHQPRYAFYCGQSWRDAGNSERALYWYSTRASMKNGWDQETFVALVEAGKAAKMLGRADDAMSLWLRANELYPVRAAEPLYEIAFMLRQKEQFRNALIFAEAASKVPAPVGHTLLTDFSVYEWKALQEVAVSGQRSGANETSANASRKMLQTRKLPLDVRLQAEKNLLWATGKGADAERLTESRQVRRAAMRKGKVTV